MSDRVYSISTDAAGFWGDYQRWQKYYPGLTSGVELIGWKHNIRQWIKSGVLVNGIHGKLGKSSNNPILRFLDASIVDTQHLATIAEQVKAKYILIHQPALEKDDLGFIIGLSEKIVVLVENTESDESWQRTVSRIDKINRTIGKNRLGIMLDLVHLGYQLQREEGGGLKRERMADDWGEILKTAKEIMEQSKIAGIHLPIGTTDDSLPESLVNDEAMWPLKRLLDSYPQIRFVTVENQNDNQIGIGEINKQTVNRNKKILEMLTRVGIGRFDK